MKCFFCGRESFSNATCDDCLKKKHIISTGKSIYIVSKEQTDWKLFKKLIVNCLIILVLFIVIFGIAAIYEFYFNKNPIPASDKTKVQVSSWDGSVSEVKTYLKNNLNDAKSYESVEWSDVKEHNGVSVVRHKYRAKNAMGGTVLKDQLFVVDKDGKVSAVPEYK
jgi:hypothetical protein